MQIKGYAFYTYVSNPDTEYDPCWSTTVVVDKEERDRVIEGCGLKFQLCDEPFDEFGKYKVIFRRYVEGRGKAKGKKNKQPKMYDVEGDEMEDTIIGNGSKVVVQFKPYSWSYKNRKGVSGDFQSIKVFELVEYVSPSTDDDADETNTGSDDSSDDDTFEDNDDIKW